MPSDPIEPPFDSRGTLVWMLLCRGQAEEVGGYGHATADDVADTVYEWLALCGIDVPDVE